MSEAGINKANREVADVDIRILKTMQPFLFFDTANTTSMSISADSVYADAKGRHRVAFQNPMEGTLTVEAQVYPFKYFALLTDGKIETEGAYPVHETVKCTEAGKLTLTPPDTGTIQAGTVFAYPEGSWGDESAAIDGTFADKVFTASTADDIAADKTYEVGYIVTRTGIKKISINNNKLPKDYFITMNTLDKDEDGLLTPFRIVYYKCAIQRNFELSFSSADDPATVSLTFDVLENKNGDYIDMIELTDDAE